MSEVFWLKKCFFCHNGFNGWVSEYNGRPFHPVCFSDFVAFKKIIKGESDKEIQMNKDSLALTGR